MAKPPGRSRWHRRSKVRRWRSSPPTGSSRIELEEPRAERCARRGRPHRGACPLHDGEITRRGSWTSVRREHPRRPAGRRRLGRGLRRAAAAGRHGQPRPAADGRGRGRLRARFAGRASRSAAICHGPWTLLEADVVRGRALHRGRASAPTYATQGRGRRRGARGRRQFTTSRSPGRPAGVLRGIVEQFEPAPRRRLGPSALLRGAADGLSAVAVAQQVAPRPQTPSSVTMTSAGGRNLVAVGLEQPARIDQQVPERAAALLPADRLLEPRARSSAAGSRADAAAAVGEVDLVGSPPSPAPGRARASLTRASWRHAVWRARVHARDEPVRDATASQRTRGLRPAAQTNVSST